MSRKLDSLPIKSIVGWFVILAAAVLNFIWLWGILFLWWALASFRAKEVAFIETVTRESHSLVYWVFVSTWFLIGLTYLAYGMFPEEFAHYG